MGATLMNDLFSPILKTFLNDYNHNLNYNLTFDYQPYGRPTIESNYIKFGIRGLLTNHDVFNNCSTSPSLPLNFIQNIT